MHCCRGAPTEREVSCWVLLPPARPRWLDFEGDGGIEPGVQLRQSLLYDILMTWRAMHLTALIMETLN